MTKPFETKSIKLSGKHTGFNQIRFTAGEWKKAIFKAKAHKANWNYETSSNYGGTHNFDWQKGSVIAFRSEVATGIPGYHLYKWLQAVPEETNILLTLTPEGVNLEWKDEGVRSTTSILPKPATGGVLFKAELE